MTLAQPWKMCTSLPNVVGFTFEILLKKDKFYFGNFAFTKIDNLYPKLLDYCANLPRITYNQSEPHTEITLTQS